MKQQTSNVQNLQSIIHTHNINSQFSILNLKANGKFIFLSILAAIVRIALTNCN